MASEAPRPASPAGNTELKRSNAARSQRRRDDGRSTDCDNLQEVPRGRSRSPGKENVALSSRSVSPTKRMEESTSAAGGQAYRLGVPLRNVSPERKAVVVQRGSARSASEKRERSTSRARKPVVEDEDVYPRSREEINYDFQNMMSEMEVPMSLRTKLLAMDPKVKESMIKGRESLSLASLHAATSNNGGSTSVKSSAKGRPPISERLKKSKSGNDLVDCREETENSGLMGPPPKKSFFFNGGTASRQTSGESQSSRPSPIDAASNSNSKNRSISDKINSSDHRHSFSVQLPSAASSRSRASSFSSTRSAMAGGAGQNALTATAYATMLKTTAASHLDVNKLKRMRAVLSSESPMWMTEFIDEGGYAAMLTRLDELINMEWREEQHDDQALHELLRCFVALPTTDRGKAALQSSMPSPFCELNDLLCSEKRPGDLTTRKHLVEILLHLADLPCDSNMSSKSIDDFLEKRENSSCLEAVRTSTTPPNIILLLCLVHSPRDPSKEAIVDFVKSSHTPRPFKVFVNELYDIARNYYWAFTHGGNRFWALADLDAKAIEGPQVPSGMTGGIENEAMHYLTTKLRLLNRASSHISRLAKSQQQSFDVDFHRLLFSSGIDRVLGALRQASQHYYPFLHLELSRYLYYARRTGFRIPVEIEYWQNASRKEPASRSERHGRQASAPSSHNGTPSLSLSADAFASKDDAFTMDSLLEQVSGGAQEQRSSPPKTATDISSSSSRPASPTKEAVGLKKATNTAALSEVAKTSEMASNTGKWLKNGRAPASPKKTKAPAGMFFQPPKNPGSAPSSPVRSPLSEIEATKTSPTRGAFDVAASRLQEPMPNPHAARVSPIGSPNTAELSGPALPPKNMAQDSVVMTAIRKWEQLASDKQGAASGSASATAAGQQQGLGLGWAPMRSKQ